jgi:hypothetical protein
MKYELTEQSVQFTFGNKRYKSGLKNKTTQTLIKTPVLMRLPLLVKLLQAYKTTVLTILS